EGFWAATERDLHIAWRTPYTHVLDSSRGMPWTTWWTGGRMNYVATALRHDGDRVAVIAEAEAGTVRTLTYGELSDQVASFAAGLRSLGVKHGDRVAVFLPLTVECAVAVLAIGAIGAVFIPIFSGYGAEAIAGRLRDAEAKVLVCADGFYRRGQVVKMKEVADEAADGAGPRALLRPSGARRDPVVDRHRLDDGSVAHRGWAHARSDHRPVRRDTRLP